MSFFLILGIAFALALDAFAVSAGVSLSRRGLTGKQTFRIAFYFGFFQFVMPIIGWLAGQSIVHYIQAIDHWVAFGLLVFIGAKMIYDSFRQQRSPENYRVDPTRGLSIFILSLATSIDALAVGLSLAFVQVRILYPALAIGIVAFFMTVLGVKISRFLGRWLGKRAELVGGLILILIGIKILLEHI